MPKKLSLYNGFTRATRDFQLAPRLRPRYDSLKGGNAFLLQSHRSVLKAHKVGPTSISRMHISRIHHSRLGSRQYSEFPRSGIRDTPFGSGIEADKNQFIALFDLFVEICTKFGKSMFGKHVCWETCIRDMKPHTKTRICKKISKLICLFKSCCCC